MSNILLVEDSPTQARVVTGSLANTEYHVDCVSRLADALQKAGRDPIDAIILDLSLPDSDGIHTYLRMQEAAPHTPIVVLTSTDDEELALEMFRQGAQDYLIKGQVTGDWIARSLRYSIQRFAAAHAVHAAVPSAEPDRELQLDVEELDAITLVRLRERQLFGGELLAQLSSRLFKMIDEEGQHRIIVNFDGVEYVSNSFLGQLLNWDEKVRHYGGGMRLCNVSSQVREQIKVRRLLAQFDICLDERTAMQSFQ